MTSLRELYGLPGQEALIKRMEDLLRGEGSPHALLIEGDPLYGSRSLMRALAALLIAPNSDEEQEDVLMLRHPDIMAIGSLWQDGVLTNAEEISKTSNIDQKARKASRKKTDTIGKEDIDGVLARVSQTPLVAKRNVLILERAERLTVEAANALLKYLEEPSGKGVILMSVESREQVLPTILSRATVVTLSTVSEEEMQEWAPEMSDRERSMMRGRPELKALWSEKPEMREEYEQQKAFCRSVVWGEVEPEKLLERVEWYGKADREARIMADLREMAQELKAMRGEEDWKELHRKRLLLQACSERIQAHTSWKASVERCYLSMTQSQGTSDT